MVIFDLDGTITVPVLDFDAIRAEIGLPPGPILESLARLSEAERLKAEVVLERHERDAAHGSQLNPGAAETVAALRATGWPVAILTRNTRRWTKFVLQKHGIAIDALATRDDAVIKPSGESVLRLCRATDSDPASSWMVGDHLFDVLSGRAAGCHTVLLVSSKIRPAYAHEAHHVISSLTELPQLIDG